jgi:hypothetical protein
VARDPSGERLVDGLAAPVGFHAEHLDDLALPTYEFGQVDPLRFPKRPCLWTHALGEKAITSGRAPGGRGLVSTFSLAGLVSAGTQTYKAGWSRPSRATRKQNCHKLWLAVNAKSELAIGNVTAILMTNTGVHATHFFKKG